MAKEPPKLNKTIDPDDKLDVNQLSQAIGYSWRTLEVFRINRLKLMRQYVGYNYSFNGAPDRVPINLLELAMNIYLQRLVAKAPQVDITTIYMQLKEIAVRFEMGLNHLIKEIDLGNTLEMAVLGAMFSMGIAKVGLNRTKVEYDGVLHDAGQPFVNAISLNNWVHDMTVNKMENVQYEGDFYNIIVEEAVELFPNEPESTFVPRDDQVTGDDLDDHNISEGATLQREEYKKTVRILDLWLPKQNLMLQTTMSDDFTNPVEKIVNVIEWDGPERGPYHKLGFARIENNTMPIAPMMHLSDLHNLSNNLYNKLEDQARRQKTVVGVRPQGKDDGNRVVSADDGDMIKMDDPKNVGEFAMGGINQQNFAFFLATQDEFKMLAGNLDSLGGLGPQSETLGQDKLLAESANTRMQKMQKETVLFVSGVVNDLAYWLWNDPYINIPLVKRVKGFEDISVPVNFGPEDRENDFLEYNVKIQPHSMQFKTPEQKLQGLRTVLSEMIGPFIPMMQAQGVTLNFEALYKTVADLGDIEELNDILQYANPQISPGQPIGQPPTKAPVTTRTNVRVNRPGATASGKSQILQQAAMGGNPQQSEKASLLRPTG